MKSTEQKEERLKRVDMHKFFIDKIEDAIKNARYIEASWLIYSCFENRYFRTVAKIKDQCKYSGGKCKKASNELALCTKINCIERIVKDSTCTCFANNFSIELLESTKKWVKDRNKLMHDLLQLEYYEDMDKLFEEIAVRGKELLLKTYGCCTAFRKDFYEEGYVFTFPVGAMESCSCKPRNGNDKTQDNVE